MTKIRYRRINSPRIVTVSQISFAFWDLIKRDHLKPNLFEIN